MKNIESNRTERRCALPQATLENDPDAFTAWLESAPELLAARVDESVTEARCENPLADGYRKLSHAQGQSAKDLFTPLAARVDLELGPGVVQAVGEDRAGFLAAGFPAAGLRDAFRLSPKRLKVGVLVDSGVGRAAVHLVDSIVKRHTLLATKSGASRRDDGRLDGLDIQLIPNGFRGLATDAGVDIDFRMTDRAARTDAPIEQLVEGGREASSRGGASMLWKDSELQPAKLAEKAADRRYDILYAIGGPETLENASRVAEQVNGADRAFVPVIGVPAGASWEAPFSGRPAGFSSAANQCVGLIKMFHERVAANGGIGIVTVPGRRSGHLAFQAGYASGEADYVLLPEMFDSGRSGRQLDSAAQRLTDRFLKHGHALAVVSEGALRLARSEGESTGDDVTWLEERLRSGAAGSLPPGVEIRFSRFNAGDLLDAAPLTADDVFLAKQMGTLSVESALAGFGGCYVSQWRDRFMLVPLSLVGRIVHNLHLGDHAYLSMAGKYLLNTYGSGGVAPDATPDEFEFFF
ncbi:MAG: 6-phosphofructokinase [Verrucomicrobiales bacterium]|jgi:6-phosphofructokinase